jgi:hypothetical protein
VPERFVSVVPEDGVARFVSDGELGRQLIRSIHSEVAEALLMSLRARPTLMSVLCYVDRDLFKALLSRRLARLLIDQGLLSPEAANARNTTAKLLLISDALLVLGCRLRDRDEGLGIAYILISEALLRLALNWLRNALTLLKASAYSLRGRLKSAGRALLRDLNEDLSSIVKEDCELMRIGEFFSRAGVYVDGDDVNRRRRLGGYGEGST